VSGFQSHERLETTRWLGAPFIAVILVTLVFAVPVRLFGLRLPEPVFAFVPAFAWAVIRPSFLGPVLLLVLGLFLDLLWNSSLGLWPISLILAYAFVLPARPLMAGQGRLVMWAWYAAACAIGFGIAYLLTMFDVLSTPNLISALFQYLVTVALYPLAHILIQQFEDADVRFR
jgi:rod shape-determining protein MreD